METVVQSEPEASSSKAKITSKSKNFKPKVVINSESKTSKIKKDKTVTASEVSKPKGVKPKAMINQKLPKSHLKVHEMVSKTSSTNPKGPIKQWVPKSEIVNAADMSKSKAKTKVMVPRQQERSQCSSPSQ